MENNMSTSNYPQAESVCNASNQGAINGSMAEPKSQGTQIPKRTLNDGETCQTIEEALIMAVGHIKSNPREAVHIYPLDENTLLQPFFDELGIAVGGLSLISNRPVLFSALHDNVDITSIEDCKRIAAEFKSLFAENGIDNVDIGYCFVCSDYTEAWNNACDVELYLSGDVECLSPAVESFNEKSKDAGGKLTLDSRLKTITGTVKTHPVKGGIFAKGRIKKANKEIENALQALIEQTTPCLED